MREQRSDAPTLLAICAISSLPPINGMLLTAHTDVAQKVYMPFPSSHPGTNTTRAHGAVRMNQRPINDTSRDAQRATFEYWAEQKSVPQPQLRLAAWLWAQHITQRGARARLHDHCAGKCHREAERYDNGETSARTNGSKGARAHCTATRPYGIPSTHSQSHSGKRHRRRATPRDASSGE